MTRYLHLPALLALAAALGCGETAVTEPLKHSFDRPVDIAFACHGSLQLESAPPGMTIESAMPTAACDLRGKPRDDKNNPENAWSGQEAIPTTAVSWYGLVLASGPGIVNVVRFGITYPSMALLSKVEDTDALTPGTNGISVGEEPVAIVTDPAGCHALTANAGSCDLSILDLNSALPPPKRNARVDRLEVKNASGVQIDARPAAMVGQPSSEGVGQMCPATPTGLVYVAYPSCHLVAGIDSSTGTVVTGIQYDAAGVPTIVGGDVTCPSECEGGGVIAPGVRPVTLDLEVDPTTSSRRLVIGADNSASITVVELDPTFRPATLSQVALEDPEGTLGISALALSPEMGMGGGSLKTLDPLDDEAPGGTFQFVYATATDGTVRVADVLDLKRECDTQVDPRFTRNVTDLSDLACFPVGDPLTPPRRAGARSPGIHMPESAIPLSVEFVKVDRLPMGGNPDIPEFRVPRLDSPETLIGHFAAVTTSNGSTYVVNVDDDDYPDVFQANTPLQVSMPLAMAHQLRDGRGRRDLTIDRGEDVAFVADDMTADSDDDKNCDYPGLIEGTLARANPRVSGPPERKVGAGSVASEKLTHLPGIRQLLCDRRAYHGGDLDPQKEAEDLKPISELMYAAPEALRHAAFPDLGALPEAETWQLVWEGSLSLNTGATDVDGPAVREGMLKVDSLGLHVLDATRPFCEAGVEPFDILKLRGCDPTIGAGDCPSGHTCFVHPESKIQGLGTCMRADEADRLANACKDFLTSIRNYTVKTTASGELVAMPRRVELSTTPLDGCESDAQCEDLADYAIRLESKDHPFQLTAQDAGTWTCEADPFRAPKGGTGKRCELRCNTTDDCYGGTVCQGVVAGQDKSGFCMEGVIPPQSCVNSSQRYQLHAGEAFSVIGSVSGFVHPIIENAAGQCVRDPMASRLLIGRIPLAPHEPGQPDTLLACDPTADPVTGQRANGTFEPNPCLATVSHVEAVTSYGPDPGNPQNRCLAMGSAIVERQATGVRFRNRNMTFTLVDPVHPGDQTCIGDRLGTLDPAGTPGQIPHVVPGYTLTFRQIGGFVPMKIFETGGEDRLSFPVKVVRGPANSLWVVDEGDFLSSSASTASSRGRVLRADPLAPLVTTAIKTLKNE